MHAPAGRAIRPGTDSLDVYNARNPARRRYVQLPNPLLAASRRRTVVPRIRRALRTQA